MTVYETRELKRWLNRPEFHRFKLIQPDWADIYMEGSFNVNNIEFKEQTYLLELTFISNRPFALHEPIKYEFQTSNTNKTFSFFDCSVPKFIFYILEMAPSLIPQTCFPRYSRC